MSSHTHASLSLDQLESDLLVRMAAHRQARSNSRDTVPVGVFVTLTALAVGVIMGLMQPPHGAGVRANEAVVLADDASLAPSTLLINSP